MDKPIYMYINSPGGVVTAGLAIYDTMQYVKPPISTLCIGQACSMGSLLLAAGEPGMRRALPNARIMLHQPSGGVSGQATDIEIHAREILAARQHGRNPLGRNPLGRSSPSGTHRSTGPLTCTCTGLLSGPRGCAAAAQMPKRGLRRRSSVRPTPPDSTASEPIQVREKLVGLYAHHCGQPVDVVAKAKERDNFMSPEEARAFGLLDEVVHKRPPTDTDTPAPKGAEASAPSGAERRD